MKSKEIDWEFMKTHGNGVLRSPAPCWAQAASRQDNGPKAPAVAMSAMLGLGLPDVSINRMPDASPEPGSAIASNQFNVQREVGPAR